MPSSKCPHCGKAPEPIPLDIENQIVYCPHEEKIHSGVTPKCEICGQTMAFTAIGEGDGIEYYCPMHRTTFRPKKPQLHVDESALDEAKNRFRANMKNAYRQSDEKISMWITRAEAEEQAPEGIIVLLQKVEGRMSKGNKGLTALRGLMFFAGGLVGMALWSILTERRKQKRRLLPLLGPLTQEQRNAFFALAKPGTNPSP